MRRAGVALRKESVDRNHPWLLRSKSIWVALRKESVDRNILLLAKLSKLNVALRKESVDRNPCVLSPSLSRATSLSARRAWIEITLVQIIMSGYASRSPQGERG